MDEQRWKRIESLYHAARERDPDERDAYLRHACAGDEELRGEVESLLRHDVSGPLDRPAWEGAAGRSPLQQDLSGRTIAQYRLLERLGSGGMGVVWKAEDTRLRRHAALKFVFAEALADEELKTRLIREAQAAAALDHPHICAVHGIHEEDGETFIAMAYIDGPSLAERIKERPLPLDEALDIAIQIADGLEEAHEKGVVHRDIKPANVMLTAKGQVKIMDFGLATLAGWSRITKPDTKVGTPAYMAARAVRRRRGRSPSRYLGVRLRALRDAHAKDPIRGGFRAGDRERNPEPRPRTRDSPAQRPAD